MQGIQGISQLISGGKARRESERNRPVYEIPEATKQALALARANYADPFMPGEGRMLDRNSMAAANAARAAIEGGGGLSSIAGIQAAEARGAENIGIASANQQQQDLANFQGQLGNMANYADQEWQMNKYAPWADKYNEAKERIGAGQQNLFGALNSAANIGLGQAMMGGKSNVNGTPGMSTPMFNPMTAAHETQHAVNTTNQFNGAYDSLSYPGTATDPAAAAQWWAKNSWQFMPKL